MQQSVLRLAGGTLEQEDQQHCPMRDDLVTKKSVFRRGHYRYPQRPGSTALKHCFIAYTRTVSYQYLLSTTVDD
jgi:hypothetical protein